MGRSWRVRGRGGESGPNELEGWEGAGWEAGRQRISVIGHVLKQARHAFVIKDLATRAHRGTLAAMNGGRGLLKAACLLAALAAGPAVAGTVYRCEGSDGVRSYTSKRIPGTSCTAVSTYTEP
ncbi:MAG TPA: DUF4124 domain-containing protein, partial [Xanthomonadaceae bacterium]|nr:DUF4124 domain-containing protein [Xanthomonadaceae bacterium]